MHDSTRSDEAQADLARVRLAHAMTPHTPRVDVAALLASAVERHAAAHQARTAAGAAQAMQHRLVADPGPTSDAACRVSRAALEAAEAAEDRAAREVASYTIRAGQLRGRYR
jgi:hypothetical protein